MGWRVMARSDVEIDHAGVAAELKSPAMLRAIRLKTEQIARAVERQAITVDGDVPLPVTTDVTTTDRAHGSVTLAHPAGQAVQAKHGSLTKAAAQSGLNVKGGDQ